MNFTNIMLKGSFVLAVVLLTQAVSAADANQDWKFDVLLDGKEIGYHNFRISGDGEQQILETEARFDVKFLFINAFRYRHKNTETWSGGCLSRIEATTNNNGDLLQVIGREVDGRFAIQGATGTESLPVCVQSFAYWNPEILQSERLLNSQTGEYEDVSVQFESRDEVRVDDQPIDALRYRLSAKAGDITLWYSSDDQPRWLALEAPAKGGRTIRYEPVAVPMADG